MGQGPNLYDLLNITKDATRDEIREAYLEAARRYHPDVNLEPNANDQFMRIQQAYEILLDNDRRARYDQELAKTEEPAGFKVNAHYSVASLPEITQTQVMYALLEIQCTALKEKSQPPPVHICLVIDCSTSMKGERLDLVKTNVLHVVRQLRVQDILSVVTFNDRAEKLILDARGAEHKQAENQISLIAASGGTEIYKGLEAGMSLLHTTKGRATRLMVLITDGRTYGDEAACLELAKQAAEDGVVLHAAGIGNEWNDDLLDKLAGLTGGTSEFISRAKDLYRFFENQIDSMERLYARNLRLMGKMDDGIALRSACRISPEVMVLQPENPLMLGSLLVGKQLTILLEYMVQSIPRHYKFIHFMDGVVRAELVSTALSEEVVRLNLRRPIGVSEAPFAPTKMLVDAVARYNLFKIQERARLELAAGESDKAAQRLQHVATHLLAQGQSEMANMVINEVRHIQETHTFSEEGDKRVKYGTRALLLPSGLENE